MTDTRCTPGAVSLKAALAIINSTANPASPLGTAHVAARRLAEIIERETNVTRLLDAIDEAMAEIAYCHADRLAEDERNHPRGSGWARVYDKLAAARDLARGQAA